MLLCPLRTWFAQMFYCASPNIIYVGLEGLFIVHAEFSTIIIIIIIIIIIMFIVIVLGGRSSLLFWWNVCCSVIRPSSSTFRSVLPSIRPFGLLGAFRSQAVVSLFDRCQWWMTRCIEAPVLSQSVPTFAVGGPLVWNTSSASFLGATKNFLSLSFSFFLTYLLTYLLT